MPPRIGITLGGFHHRVARQMMGRQLCKGLDRRWLYPPLAEAMAEVVLQEVDTYVSHHHNKVVQYITNRPIMNLCLVVDRRLDTRVLKRWWDQ